MPSPSKPTTRKRYGDETAVAAVLVTRALASLVSLATSLLSLPPTLVLAAGLVASALLTATLAVASGAYAARALERYRL
ncbi:hypothetical protein [Haloprofundus salilacus]|uniref:hypothetical protein n=1 Tax=Haloprofundus salilacus TaxID=2876190 RepID=UPI001CCB9FDC|nr:hypothetical protein [Haloprofundus salilacus]